MRQQAASGLAPPEELRREALRQQLLLRTLMRDAEAATLAGWVRQEGARRDRAVSAYRANASAGAERALAAAYPTVQAMLGEETFAQLARAAWQRQPPERGDLAQWGAHLPKLLDANEALREWPYLGDAARLDWAVHRASLAADAACEGASLQCLGTCDPQAVCLRLHPALAVLSSAWPIASIWQAHHAAAGFEDVRAALARRRAETALVYREGWRVQVIALDAATHRFTAALLAGRPLGAALQAAGDGFDFQPWLVRAVQLGWLWRAEPAAPTDLEENAG